MACLSRPAEVAMIGQGNQIAQLAERHGTIQAIDIVN